MKTEIDKFEPCCDGLDFRKKFNTFEEAWNACERGDWMLWIAARLEADIRILTLAKGLCANTVRHLMQDKRSTAAVDVAIAFGNGEIDENELETAATHASAVYDYASASAAHDYAADSAYAAADSAYATAAADSAYAAADSAYAAADSAYASAYASADYADAKKQNQKQTADICREVLTNEVLRLISEL